MLPIAKQALEQGRYVTYLHAALDAEHHAFVDAVEELRSAYPNLLETVTLYENEAGGGSSRAYQREPACELPAASGPLLFCGATWFYVAC
ncbi:hypothetical protein HSBAA_21010 [Vreelandella sulfidaeris]|uniref:Uncharacterized protein n=1 Tax=Vreelandella sulfidaeris TaxID=115553 RepID=A0A455U4F6_9GAMM|nr:hypothetical protein HSBAA_21010 [Halomonas sulfidaeris]